ncbi:hypothetical protein QTI66_37255 [Variovorax sp. J22R133]|uniref:hypothetical protein n=1 Tax=Variovorax brevis TaxID=3053503 RepID=UPI0025784E60|nr:hypothetical protein [Variovorax sp. J22R133]MDM0117750.1 hypothetical protein [Variovorax sp. J22R133]
MRIALTSCMDADDYGSQPFWNNIQSKQPDALLLLGDHIYLDWDVPLPVSTMTGKIRLLVLEKRSKRTAIGEVGSSPLDQTQGQAQLEILGSAAGLLIIAGSSPMHHYGRFKTGRRSRTDATGERVEFPDYKQFIDKAAETKRAILYLAGDIHRNSYGGPVKPGSSIVQVLASGARGGEASGNYVLIDIEDADGMTGSVVVGLFNRDSDTPCQTVTLTLQRGRWFPPPPPGECAKTLALKPHSADQARIRKISASPRSDSKEREDDDVLASEVSG